MFSRLLHFLVLASTLLATTATYMIRYGQDNSKCLDIKMGSVKLGDCTLSSSWTTGKGGKIQISNSGDCLYDGGKGDLNIIDCDSSDAAPWTYNATSQRYISDLSKLCMDLKDGDTTKEVLLWDCNLNSTNQQWSVPVAAYSFLFQSEQSKCLESIEGGEVRVGDCSDTRWTTVGDDSSRIHSGSPGNTKDICLKIKSDTSGDFVGGEIIQAGCDLAPAWTYDTNSHQFKFQVDDLCMEGPDDGKYPKEAKAQKCDPNKASQKWIRKPLN